ncbi:RNA-directed DNA polymerase, eukaryota [Tanacetum coccineum]
MKITSALILLWYSFLQDSTQRQTHGIYRIRCHINNETLFSLVKHGSHQDPYLLLIYYLPSVTYLLRPCYRECYHVAMISHNEVSYRFFWFLGFQFDYKEDQTQSISQSIFVTNFPAHVTTHDLWKVCNDYGVVVDDFIPYKKSKAGKRFAFVQFIKVDNIDHLVANLCTIWIGRFHLHENVSRFHRERKPYAPSHPSIANERNSPGSYVSILKSGKMNNVMSDQVLPYLILDYSCILDRDLSLSLMGKVKDITAMPNLYVILEKRGCLDFLEGLPLKVCTHNTFAKVASKWGDLVEWEDLVEKSLFCKRLCVKTKLNEIIAECFKVIVNVREQLNDEEDAEDDRSQSGDKVTADNDVERVFELSCMHNNELLYDNNHNNIMPYKDKVISEDPFNLYDILNKRKVVVT